jgi:hypothetical protein
MVNSQRKFVRWLLQRRKLRNLNNSLKNYNVNISILHPSWQRPELARKCYDEWMGKATYPGNIEYILCLSHKDSTLEGYVRHFSGTNANVIMLDDNGLVKQVNFAAEHAMGNLLIAVSDDFGCPDNWDALLEAKLHDKQDYIVKTSDGLQPFIMTLPMMDRAYYERFGYIYHPRYNHMHGDEELAYVGQGLKRTITLDLHFPHRHYSTGKMKRDATNVQNDSFYPADARTFAERRSANFDL